MCLPRSELLKSLVWHNGFSLEIHTSFCTEATSSHSKLWWEIVSPSLLHQRGSIMWLDKVCTSTVFLLWFLVAGFFTACFLQLPADLPESSDDEAIEKASENRTATCQDSDSKPAVKKKRKQPTECFLSQPEEKQESSVKAKRRKKKKISDVLQKSPPKPGVPADLQNLLTQHFGENRSVIEIEELKLSDSCFLPANDLTHSFSSYLKEICPKWAKLRRSHKEKKSVVMLVLCSSALRSLELIKSMTAFKGDCRVIKLFAKHIKIKEQMNMLEKGMFHIGVGTPGRVKALVEQDALCLNSTKYMILDWNWRDQKLRRMMDIPEIKKETIDLLEKSIIKLCRDGSVKLGLF
ncbi:protein CMSS1 isoform X2 [Motacilla alba alba]|uniref:protein CMSS1 isoform X2 n=1 Tax=Motacilla alba alba TaxID=1094192 RepID=UPI0018D57CB6|nr:protein CMSS1 isoform X2 [Motacilla alba alba]